MCCRVGMQSQCHGRVRDGKDSKRTIQLRVVDSAVIACVSSSTKWKCYTQGFSHEAESVKSRSRVEERNRSETEKRSTNQSASSSLTISTPKRDHAKTYKYISFFLLMPRTLFFGIFHLNESYRMTGSKRDRN